MKALILAVCAMAFSLHAMADCQLVSSQQKLSYGRMSAAERQAEGNTLIEMPEKQIVLNVICDEPSRIRLFLAVTYRKGMNLVLVITASCALLPRRQRWTIVQSIWRLSMPATRGLPMAA